MKKPSNLALVKISINLLALALVAKGIGVALSYYIDADGVEIVQTKSYKPQYQRVDFRYMIEKEQPQKKEPPKKKVVNGTSIKNMILKGLYGKNEKGFAIVALKSSPKKTSIVKTQDEFAGYKLTLIRLNDVVFTKNNKEYILAFTKPKDKKQRVTRVKEKNVISENIENDEPREVLRDDIEHFAKNPREIWKNISIHDVRENGKIVGFKVTRINKQSVFAKLGLLKNDIIIKANNIELKSYKNAMDIYNKIDEIDTMQIVVKRDNQEKELIYEIN